MVSDEENAAEYLRQEWVDEVFINLDESAPYSKDLVERCSEMGLTLHVNLAKVTNSTISKQSAGRVGKNGKIFKMYKFCSMYMDAEEQKAKLMKENKMSSNLMFKMDLDPRTIGNKVLPDGTKKAGVGQFICSTSIDEFPQFFNVLIGRRSIIETTKKKPYFMGFVGA